MKRYNESFSREELNNALHSHDNEAEELLNDINKWTIFKNKIEEFLHNAYDIPVLGGLIDDIISMIQLVDSYIKKEYRDIPWTSVVSIVGALIYVLSPVDLIPDVIPVIGYLDDAAVILLVLELGVKNDLNKYKSWQEGIREKKIIEFEEMMADSLQEIIDDSLLGALILCSDNTLEILCVDGSDVFEGEPYSCKMIRLKMPVDMLKDLYIENEKEYIEFLNGVLSVKSFHWTPIGKLEAIHECEFNKYEDYFAVLEDEDE